VFRQRCYSASCIYLCGFGCRPRMDEVTGDLCVTSHDVKAVSEYYATLKVESLKVIILYKTTRMLL
jgi:hypothetical protein